MRERIGSRWLIAAALASTSSMAFAQAGAMGNEAQPPAASQEGVSVDRSGQVADVVVTAQRREERLQNVPIAVSAVTSDSLAKSGSVQFTDLQSSVPSLTITRTSYTVAPFLRGVGNSVVSAGNDPSVAVYIDGVYQPNGSGLLFAFNNIERVEVLKGPQGTLFGRNATGGLIQVVTKDPTTDFRAGGSLGYGNYDTFQTGGYINGGSGNVAGELSFVYSKQSDGWGKNLFNPSQAPGLVLNGAPYTLPQPRSDVGITEDLGIRGKVLVDFGDATQLRLSGIYMRNSGDQGLYRRALPGAVLSPDGGAHAFPFTGGFYDDDTDTNYYNISKTIEGAAQLDHDLGFANLKSITAYYSTRAESGFFQDSTPLPTDANAILHSFQRQFTQELQLLSPSGSKISWILGAFYLHSTAGYDPLLLVHFGSIPGQARYQQQTTDSISGFGQATIPLFEKTRITLGGRYTSDHLNSSSRYVGLRTDTNPTPPVIFQNGVVSGVINDQKATYSKFTWKASLDHNFTPDIMGYVSASTGFKAGTFNAIGLCQTAVPTAEACAVPAPPVKAETITDYEIGLKSDLFDRRLRLNLSGFYYDYSNLQVQINQLGAGGVPVVILKNAAKARIYGGELDSSFVVSSALRGSLGVSVLHSEYLDYPNAIYYQRRVDPVTNLPVAPYNDVLITLPNAKGRELNRAPKFTLNAMLDYTVPDNIIPEETGTFNINASLYHSGRYYWDVGNIISQKPYDLLSANLAWTLPSKRVTINLWGRNLLGKKYYTFMQSSSDGDQGAPAAPFTFGIRVDAKWP